MSTEPQRTCPSCGNELPEAIQFCPVCMLRKGLAGAVESGASSFETALKPTSEQPVQRYEHYELVTGEDGTSVELGRGAMGVTYKAVDVNLRCPVTLKVISERYLGDESARLRFLREARAAASVRHPNVASVFHLGTIGQNYFYAMEFVEGETLERLIKRSGRLEVKLALEIASQVAAGLAAVHKQKLVHRDIKPSNIMVTLEEGGAVTAKIIDLGLAKSLDQPGAQTAISTPGAFAGTPEFASPEQFAGVPVDIRSDLYSLGVTLWQMVTGKTPFRGNPGEVMSQHQRAPLPLEQLEAVPQPVVVLLEVLLVGELAAFNMGLCLMTTRLPVADIADYEGGSALRLELEQLSSDAGAKLLRALGVKGLEAELRSASDEFRGHCLALTLLGSYLTDAYNGDVRRREEVSKRLAYDVRQGVYARKVMESYQTWFGEGPEVSILRLLGLFDRPADEKALGVLLKPRLFVGLQGH